MKCTDCSKVIPDGFTDCPWCGAAFDQPSETPGRAVTISHSAALATGAQRAAVAAAPEGESGRNILLTWLVSALSLPFCLFAAYVATYQKYGFVEWSDSSYLVGAVLGPYLTSAILVFLYYWLRRKNPHYSAKVLAIACAASFFALVALSQHLRGPHSTPEVAEARHVADLLKNPKPNANRPRSVWDEPMLALLADLQKFNDSYVAEISKLDETAQPLYTPESFRDWTTMRQMIAQLQARLAVAEKYSTVRPVLDKMKEYVAAVQASEKGKREFLEGYESTVPKGPGPREAASAHEHEWLQASIDLYEFMLAKKSGYSVDGKNLNFQQKGLAEQFYKRLQSAQVQRQQFLRALGVYNEGLRAARAQVGLEP